MFHILLALVFKNQPWKTGTFSKVCLVSNGCEESQSSRVSCRLRFHCICCLRYTHSGNCKLPESHNTQMKKKNTPNKRNTHTVKTETCWKWLKLVEVDSPRVFVLSFFNVFVSISQETSSSERDVTVAGCTPTETQLTQLRATTASEITTVLKVIGTKNLDDRKKTTVKFLLLFMPIVCPDSHIYFTF